jgi:hypothetical protein
MGLTFLVAEKANRLPSLTSINVPAGVDAKAVQSYLLTVRAIIVCAGGMSVSPFTDLVCVYSSEL